MSSITGTLSTEQNGNLRFDLFNVSHRLITRDRERERRTEEDRGESREREKSESII